MLKPSEVVVMFATVMLALFLGMEADKPSLELRASPRLMMSGNAVLLTAELKGPESEAWYCPQVTWLMPDGTKAVTESDCDPWDKHDDYPRRWTRRLVLGEGDYTFVVELHKAGKKLATASVNVEVK